MPNPSIFSTTKMSNHEPCSFSYTTVGPDGEASEPVVYGGGDTVDVFLERLQQEEKAIRTVLDNVQPIIMSPAEERLFCSATVCHICRKNLKSQDAVRDHDHLTVFERIAGYVGAEPPGKRQVSHHRGDPSLLHLVLRKGVYPYEYMDSMERFKETELPPKEDFYSGITAEHIISEEYVHAQQVWREFGLRTMGEYHDLYLKTDVLLLPDVFEAFRSLCLSSYGLDPAHYITAPMFAWDAALKMGGTKLELLTDPDIHLLVESDIRGGVAVLCDRFQERELPPKECFSSMI